jgi:hypothetical protein
MVFRSAFKAFKRFFIIQRFFNTIFTIFTLLGEVGLQSLLDRRMEHSVIFLFKLFRGLQECPHVLERISLRVSRSGSRVRSVFYIGQRHTDIGLKSPVTRMLRNYQSVEAHIDIFCCSISQIKKFFSISS